jgi:anaphase-promoting complex subunit 8
MDGYCLYLYGVVLKNLSLSTESQSILLEAVHKEPCHWGAWQELAFHITDRSALQNLKLPGKKFLQFFSVFVDH